MPNEEILYHYTSIAGLNDILCSRSVWASDCRYLNDEKELVHALQLFLSRFDGATRKALSLALSWHNLSRAHCVFSLSRSPEVLSQWRAYSDDGRGAALGFKRKHLPGIGQQPPRVLVDCVYDDHHEFIDGVVERCEHDIVALLKMHKEEPAVNSFCCLVDENPQPLVRLYAELLRIKNPAFREEQEVRLVLSAPMKQVRTRVAKGLIVPYVEHEFVDKDEEHLWCVAPEVWLGPRCDRRSKDGLGSFGQFGWSIEGIHQFDCGYV